MVYVEFCILLLIIHIIFYHFPMAICFVNMMCNNHIEYDYMDMFYFIWPVLFAWHLDCSHAFMLIDSTDISNILHKSLCTSLIIPLKYHKRNYWVKLSKGITSCSIKRSCGFMLLPSRFKGTDFSVTLSSHDNTVKIY